MSIEEARRGRRSLGRSPSLDVIVVGGVDTDYTVRGPRLPSRDSVQGSDFLTGPGGKGLNQAVAAARLGAKAGLVACVGNDPRGRAILRDLMRERVERRYVVRDTVAMTGVTVIQVDRSGRKQTMNAPGANLCLGVRDVRRAGPALRAVRVLVVQLEPPLVAIAEAVRIAKAAGVSVVLNAGPARPLPTAILRGATIVRANTVETETLTGVRVSGRPSARRAERTWPTPPPSSSLRPKRVHPT